MAVHCSSQPHLWLLLNEGSAAPWGERSGWPASLAGFAHHADSSARQHQSDQAASCAVSARSADQACMQAVHDLAKEDKESAWVGRLLCQARPHSAKDRRG